MSKTGTCPECKTNAVVLHPIDGTKVTYICGDCIEKGVDTE